MFNRINPPPDDIFTSTYGRMVWEALNNQTKQFMLLQKKVVWGKSQNWGNRKK